LTPDQENGGVWYRFAGDTWLHVYQTSTAGTAQNTVAGITVTNIEEVMKQLRQRGVEFEDYEMTENGLATFETAKVAWFRDPDGNTIELSQTL
ncbi:MAG TPA: VOC family protein, partial [Acidimicrobiia bacterium]|nr:VOC family protein [Acidimicrobiia bacterium]